MPDQASKQPLHIASVRVRADRIELLVRAAHQRYCFSDGALIEQCLVRYPLLGEHTCRNQVGSTFSAVMRSTSTPHVLEHLIIDEQTRAACQSERIFTGSTQWDAQAETNLQALVAVSYEDDVVALGAIKQATDFLNKTLLSLRGGGA